MIDCRFTAAIPELQRCSVFRTGYESTTLRGNLGRPMPQNRYVA